MKDIVKKAEMVIVSLKKNKMMITTSQIRKFLTAVNILNNKVQTYELKERNKDTSKTDIFLPDELAFRVKYLKVILAYQTGRIKDKKVGNRYTNEMREFVKEAELNEFIDAIGNDMKKYKEFAKYIEALVAYHKFYGGRD